MATAKPSGMWGGLAKGIESHAFYRGVVKYWIVMVSRDDVSHGFEATVVWDRRGPGVGVSLNFGAVLITSLWDPTKFHVAEPMGWDFQLAFGGKAAQALKPLKAIARAGGLSKYNAETIFKPAFWEGLERRLAEVKRVKSMADAESGIKNTSSRPQIAVVDFGVGAGVGVYKAGMPGVVVTNVW